MKGKEREIAVKGREEERKGLGSACFKMEGQGFQTGKEVKLTLFADDMTLYIENPKGSTRKLLLLLLLSRFSRVRLCATP